MAGYFLAFSTVEEVPLTRKFISSRRLSFQVHRPLEGSGVRNTENITTQVGKLVKIKMRSGVYAREYIDLELLQRSRSVEHTFTKSDTVFLDD